MAIEIVEYSIKHGDFPVRYVTNYQRVMSVNIGSELSTLLGEFDHDRDHVVMSLLRLRGIVPNSQIYAAKSLFIL